MMVSENLRNNCVLVALTISLLLPVTLAQTKELSGEISVFLNSYYDPTNDKETADLMTSIAKEYEALHPGVTIKLVENLPSGQDMETFLAARMAADQSPDIMWQQFGTRNLRADKWWVPLNPYFDMPNPYIVEGTPGHDKWSDSFPDFVTAQTRAADGNWYQVSLDWVETGLYYNKDLFAEAGVDPTSWKNWSEYVADMNKIRETTGADPVGMFMKQQGWSNWWWADDIFITVAWADMANEFYMEKYNDPNRPWRQLNPEEIAKAILEGKLDATDPRMDTYLKMSKEFVSLYPLDYASLPTLDDLDPLFFSGQLASVWTGTWKNKLYTKDTPFELGVAYLPPITAEDAPGGQGTAYRVGGPSSAGQYGIAQSAAKNGKLDLAADFLMFLAAPQNFGRLVASFGGYIPMVAGAETSEVMTGFSEVAALPERLFSDPDNRLTLESADAWSQTMQGYFLGGSDEATTKTKLQEIWMTGATKLCADQKYDWCPN
jgi:ABC-type glycerol-3-phosphate transport system substrate-binding protein